MDETQCQVIADEQTARLQDIQKLLQALVKAIAGNQVLLNLNLNEIQ